MSQPDESDERRRAAGLPPQPRPPGEPGPEVRPPRAVRASVWLWLAAGVLLVLGYLFMVVHKQTFIVNLQQANTDPAIPPDRIAAGATVLLWTLLIGAIVFACLFALFAYKLREGSRSARTTLTVLFVLTIAGQLVMGLVTVLTLLASILAVCALVLVYLSPVAGYFPKVPRTKKAR